MARDEKLLFIGLDSADKDLLRRWVDDGSLPVMASLMAESAWAEVANPPVFGSGVTWRSLFYGVNLGRHGRYFQADFFRRNRVDRPAADGDPQAGLTPLWEALSRAGRRVAVIDVPGATLSPELNGLQVTDWLTHDRSKRPALSTPPGLIDEILDRHGRDPVGSCDSYSNRAQDKSRLRDRVLARVEAKADLACELLGREPWDFFMVVFHDAHCIGHQCWHIHDPEHVHYEASLAARMGDPVKDVYQALDRAIGRILESAGDDLRVVFYAGPGMRRNYSGKHLLDEVLRRRNADRPAFKRRLLGRCKDLLKFPVRALPARLRRPIMRIGKRVESDEVYGAWRRRPCFQVLPHDDISGAIRLNIAGRDPDGRIAPEAVDEYLDALAEDLLEITNDETGQPFIRNVFRSKDICWGDCLDDLPDLFVEWNRDAPLTRLSSPKIGRINRKQVAIRTGDHAPHCIVFFRAPGLPPGEIARRVTHMDLAPTLAALLGVGLEDVDGTPVEAVLGAPAAKEEAPAEG